MIDPHRAPQPDAAPAAITFLAVTPAAAGQPAELAAMRVRDSGSHAIEDFLGVSVVDRATPWSAGGAPPATPAMCVEALNWLLEGSVLAAWDVSQVLADLEDALGEASAALDIGDHLPVEVASLVRPFVDAADQIDDACEWADFPVPSPDSAVDHACAALEISRRVFDVARMGNRAAAVSSGAAITTH
jgi:hypothetical protein